MIRTRIQQSVEWLKHVITQPREELDRWQYAVRFSYELAVHGWKALNRDNAPQMAAALAFRTLFALLPVVVVSAVLVNAMQGPEQFGRMVHWVINVLGLDSIRVAAQGAPEAGTIALGDTVESLVQKMASINLAALGWIGLAIVIYAAISLMVTIENSFNAIYGAPEGRSWWKRIPTYWLVLTLGPLFIGVTLVVDNKFADFIAQVETWRWVLSGAKLVWGFCVAWLFIFVIYRLVPNTAVTNRAAMIGSFVAALLLQIGKGMLAVYFGNAVAWGNIIGTLGVIPVVMYFIYLMWLVILFGLEVSATIQRVQGLHLEELKDLKEKQPQTGLLDPASVVTVMELSAECFVVGKPITMREIADEVALPESIVNRMVDRLVREGFLHRVEGIEGAVSLARVPDQIGAERLIELGYELVDEGNVGRQSTLVLRLREAQRALARQATMASLLSNGQSRSGDNQVSAC